jgi:cytochrome b561
MSERLWCPRCETDKYHFDHSDERVCRECEHELVNPPTKIRLYWKAQQVGALSLLLGIFLMPIGWVLLNIGEKPLYATKTVTVTQTQTQTYGLIPGLMPWVFLWILLFVIYLYMGVMPRGFR